MTQIVLILEIVAPVFVLAAIGYFWVKLGYEYPIEFVTKITMLLSIPCLVFVSLMQAKVSVELLTTLALATAFSYLALTVGFWCLIRLWGLDQPTFLAPLIFGNTGNLGLPLALFAFGDVGLNYAVVIFAVMVISSFTFGIWLVAGRGSLGKIMREPVVLASVLGGVLLWNGWQLPAVMTNTLSLLGQVAIPMMLITLGVSMARLKVKGISQATKLSILKVIMCVSIAWGSAILFSLSDMALGVLIVQISTPVAVTSYLLAEKYGADADAVAALVVTSTAISVLTLPIILSFIL